jgi:hypothetical protein
VIDWGNETNKKKESVAEGAQSRTPTISLLKGGGTIRGMGDKFAAKPVTGTGSMLVPIGTSSGRSGFGSHPALSCDSAARNGPLAWVGTYEFSHAA